MAEPIIRLEHVTRTYHVGDIDVHALQDVSLTINKGEFVAIMGHSGSGKSTLMAVLGCLDRPSSGRYFFEGTDVAGLEEPERASLRSERLGFVFQSFNLLSRTSAIENVALPLFYSATGPASATTRTERARAVLTLLGLGDRERNTPGQLSGGQQQRVAIARALINNPGLLLADEPTGNLDTRTSHEIMETLTRLNREQGVTIIVVTHEADIAAYADRVLTMRDGQVVSDTRNPKPAKTAEAPRTVRAGPRPVGCATAPPVARHRTAHQHLLGLRADDHGGRHSGDLAQHDALGLDHAGCLHRRRRADRHGRRRPGRQRCGAQADRAARHQSGGGAAGRAHGWAACARDPAAPPRSPPPTRKRSGARARAVSEVSYLIRQSGQVQAGNQNWATQIQGISANYPPMTNWRIEVGREISPDDEASAALVAVIGQTVSKQLFGESQIPIGALIQVKGMPMRVIGVLESKGQTPFGQDQDDLVMIPFTTAERKVLGVASPSQAQTQLNWIYPRPAQPLRADAASGRLRQPDLRASRQFGGRAAGDPRGDRDSRPPPPHQARRRQ